MSKIKLAVIGCGAMSEFFHIPAIINSNVFELVGVFDVNVDRAKLISTKYAVPVYDSDYTSHLKQFNAAVVAVPNVFHLPVTIDLLNNSKHVFVEKPMALTSNDCVKMIMTAKEKKLVLGVGNIRRYYPVNKFIKSIIEERTFGEMQSVEVNEGYIFDWKMASNSFINKDLVKGGVLLDIGVHIIDLLVWWFGNLKCITYQDDEAGGLEGDCKILFKTNNDQDIKISLSRQRNLENRINIVFEKAIINIGVEPNSKSYIKLNSLEEYLFSGSIINKNKDCKFEMLLEEQIEDFANSIIESREPFVSGESASRAISIIEECYGKKQNLIYEWENL